MYKLNVTADFSAAHKLTGYDGPCKNLHGHNWKIRVAIDCKKTDEIGLTIDFGIVKKLLNEIVDKLDHQLLNDLEIFKNINPTSENIAKYFYDEMRKKIESLNCNLTEVEIWESDKSSLIYSDLHR